MDREGGKMKKCAEFDLNAWIKLYVSKVEKIFHDRIVFIGIQGSYARKEQSYESDIDMVLILDELSAEDVKIYDNELQDLPNRDLLCGFLSGINVLKSWERSDLFQFLKDTLPIKGSLGELQDFISKEDVKRAVRIGACNIYHSCVHNLFCEKSDAVLKGLVKSAIFTLKAKVFYETGEYARNFNELCTKAAGADRVVLDLYVKIKQNLMADYDFDKYAKVILNWTTDLINKYAQ